MKVLKGKEKNLLQSEGLENSKTGCCYRDRYVFSNEPDQKALGGVTPAFGSIPVSPGRRYMGRKNRIQSGLALLVLQLVRFRARGDASLR